MIGGAMAKRCSLCGKGPVSGSSITRRGVAKKAGGVGIRIVRRNKRRFLPNLQKIRVRINGAVRQIRICTRCLKAGKVQKAA